MHLTGSTRGASTNGADRTNPPPDTRMRLRSTPILVAAAALFAVPVAARAQAGLGTANQMVTINATKASSISLTINAGATQTLAALVDSTTNDFATPVNITTAWDVHPAQTGTVSLVAWFADPAAALVSGTDVIPSSMVSGRMSTGLVPAYTAFSGTAVGSTGVAGATLELMRETIAGANKKLTRTDDLELRIDLTGQDVNPGSYSGTLILKAITQ